MSNEFELVAEIRTDAGKGASRRLRRSGKLPAILYGGDKEPVSIMLDHDVVVHQLEREAFFSHILDVRIGGENTEKAILRDVQRHPHKVRLLHIDLQRVSATEKLYMHVPLHFTNEDVAPGVKQGGGIVSHLMSDVEIACLPGDLPEYIEVDVSTLNVGDVLHLSDLKLPPGVEITALAHDEGEHDQPVVSIHLPRAAVEEEGAPEAPEAAAGEAEEAGEESGESGEK